jgi:hypothetical protein
MTPDLPTPVPEIPVKDMSAALTYYQGHWVSRWTGAAATSCWPAFREAGAESSWQMKRIGRTTATQGRQSRG